MIFTTTAGWTADSLQSKSRSGPRVIMEADATPLSMVALEAVYLSLLRLFVCVFVCVFVCILLSVFVCVLLFASLFAFFCLRSFVYVVFNFVSFFEPTPALCACVFYLCLLTRSFTFDRTSWRGNLNSSSGKFDYGLLIELKQLLVLCEVTMSSCWSIAFFLCDF